MDAKSAETTPKPAMSQPAMSQPVGGFPVVQMRLGQYPPQVDPYYQQQQQQSPPQYQQQAYPDIQPVFVAGGGVTVPDQQAAYMPMGAAPGAQVPLRVPVPTAAPAAATGSQYRNATPIAALGESSAPVDCPSCGQRALTSTNFVVGNTTHGWAVVLCCLLCVGCVPYILNGTKDVEHKCGKCGVSLATWHRSGHTDAHMHN